MGATLVSEKSRHFCGLCLLCSVWVAHLHCLKPRPATCVAALFLVSPPTLLSFLVSCTGCTKDMALGLFSAFLLSTPPGVRPKPRTSFMSPLPQPQSPLLGPPAFCIPLLGMLPTHLGSWPVLSSHSFCERVFTPNVAEASVDRPDIYPNQAGFRLLGEVLNVPPPTPLLVLSDNQ